MMGQSSRVDDFGYFGPISQQRIRAEVGVERGYIAHLSVEPDAMTPNLAVNADAPRARLRRHGGSPVTLVR